MKTRTIGDRHVSVIGLGEMPMSLEGRPDEAQSIRTIHTALDAGVTLVDTADSYSQGGDDQGHGEWLVAEALARWSGDPDDVLVATKGGHVRPGDGSWTLDGRPEHLKQACDESLKRLGVDAIGLYQFHRPDPQVPIAESVGALADLKADGRIVMAGVSNFDVDQIREAMGIVELASVQNQFSPAFRSSAPELAFCAAQGIAFLPYSPLGGMGNAADLGDRHAAFAEVAEGRGVSPHQVALAWELAQADVVVPIPGASRPETITDSLHAADLVLSAEELALLDTA